MIMDPNISGVTIEVQKLNCADFATSGKIQVWSFGQPIKGDFQLLAILP